MNISPSIILDEQTLRDAVKYIQTQDAFAFDVEAQGNHREVPHLASLSWISLATKGMAIAVPFGHSIGDKIIGETKRPEVYKTGKKKGETYFKTVPLYEAPPKQLDPSIVFEILSPIFSDTSLVKAGHDEVYDLVSTPKYLGFVAVPPYHDTKVGDWILDENKMRHGLKELIETKYGFRYDYENIGARVEDHPFSLVGYYSYCDSKYAYLEYLDQVIRIEEQGLQDIFNLEMNILNTMVGMRMVGARVDVDRLKELQERLSEDLIKQEASIYLLAGKKFNINSVKQKQEVLYKDQELKPWKLTDGGRKKKDLGMINDIYDYSTDDEVLASYPENAVANAMREYGDTSKLLTTYVDSWLGTEDKETIIYDDHIYAGFQQYGTVTGRFSCRKPNLQNIPRPSSELGKLVRGVFIAEPGGKLVVADYGQIELVVLAHYIGEGKLYEAFLNGIDPHLMTAAMVLGKDPVLCTCEGVCKENHVTKIERQDLGKTLGFAVVYGAGINKVASMAKITPAEAKKKLAKHAEMFPEVHDFRQQVIDLCRSRKPVPYITTLLGRRRRVPAINSKITGIRMGAERQVFNSLIQGGAADLLKLAMVRVDATLPQEIKLVLTVHDEIVLSAPDEFVPLAEELLREAMVGEGIQSLIRVPLLTDVKTVTRWSDAK